MIDPYDVIAWHASSNSESGVQFSHWQEQDKNNYCKVLNRWLAFIYHMIALLALCAVVYALLR